MATSRITFPTLARQSPATQWRFVEELLTELRPLAISYDEPSTYAENLVDRIDEVLDMIEEWAGQAKLDAWLVEHAEQIR